MKHISYRFIKIPEKEYSFQATPVTQEQWRKVMGKNPSRFKGEHLPVESVSWDDVQEFLKKLNVKSKKWNYRLATEEEWEHACRAGSTTEYYWGDKFNPDYAWCYENANNQTHPVGQKKPNAWGLYDMSGNVWEWTNSLWEPGSSYRVLRGGGWYNHPQYLRPAYRNYDSASYRYSDSGFRLVRQRKDSSCTQKSMQEKSQSELTLTYDHASGAESLTISIDITRITQNLSKLCFYVVGATSSDTRSVATGGMDQESQNHVQYVEDYSTQKKITINLRPADKNVLKRLAAGHLENGGKPEQTKLELSELEQALAEAQRILRRLKGES